MATLGVAASAALLKPVIEKLSSEAWKNLSMFWRLDKKCDNLKNMLTTISTVLTDAEKKSVTDELIRHWLLQLQDVAYDIDDFLDDFQIEARRRSKSKSLYISARAFFSSDNPVKFRVDMVKKLKKITKRLSKIMEVKKTFKLVEGNVLMEEDKTERVTTSSVNESKVYGRKEEKEKLISHLLHDKNDEILSVLPIVGMGGVGKTTLAKIVCNDPAITEHYNPIIWIHVPMNFKLSKILCKLIECSGEKCDVSEKEAMKNKLQDIISKTKFLVVLDDVWNDDFKKWEELETILTCGEIGSKILVTTRIGRAAEIMGTFDPFHLNPLKFEDCWELFKQRAFRHINENENPILVDIGKQIVGKCKGLPLAAEHLGNLAGSKKVEWTVIRDNEIWKLEEYYEKEVKIVPSLLLSYIYLPSYLKQCFAYCSLFPKGFLFQKEYLIQLWTCEGFIPKNKPKATLWFDELLSQSFFEVSERIRWDSHGYRMHDLIHDLACYVAGDQFFIRSECENSQNIASWRYSSIWLNNIVKIKKLRSFICHDNMDSRKNLDSIMQLQLLRVLDLNGSVRIEVLPDGIGNLRHLRYLNLSNNYSLEMLPNSVTALMSLEVLELYGCSELNMLPTDLGALENLEVLNLRQCSALKNLPTSLCSLTNLRTLDLECCGSLASIPKGIGNLTKLENLPVLIIGGEEGCTIGELGQLNLLKNDLRIVVKEAWGLQDVSKANFGAKIYLKSLELFTIYKNESYVELRTQVESLELPPQLEELCIKQFSFIPSKFGFNLPRALRITDFSFRYRNLVKVHLDNINECECFPQFGKLPRLKILYLSLQFSITKIKEQFSGNCGKYPELQMLDLTQDSSEKLFLEPEEEIVETEVMRVMFPCLKELRLVSCPFIAVFPFLPRSIEKLAIEGDCGQHILSIRSMQGLNQLKKLELMELPVKFNVFDGMRYLTTLEELEILCCDWSYLPTSMLHHDLPSLESLNISWMKELRTLEEERLAIQGESSRCQPPPLFTTLKYINLKLCESLIVLPNWFGNLPFLQSLYVESCPNLIEFLGAFEHLALLKSLELWNVPGLQRLPRGTEQLASLQKLDIYDCFELSNQYRIQKFEDGEVYYQRDECGDWYDISHIPNIHICPIRVVNKDGDEIEV